MADKSGRQSTKHEDIEVFRFLTGIAGTLHSLGQLDSKEAERFRNTLHQLQAGSASPFPSALSLFDALEREESALWSAILQRYGRYTVHRNLFRFTINEQTKIVEAALQNLGHKLLAKAELLFNRPFCVIQDNSHERTTLFSTGIIDVAKSIDLGCRIIEVASSGLNKMIPTDQIGMTAEDIKVDEKISAALGFADLEYEATLYGIEHTAVEALHGGLSGVAISIAAFADQFRHNAAEIETQELDRIIESLTFTVRTLALFDIKPHASLDTWEMRRIRVTKIIRSLSGYITDLAQTMDQLLTKIAAMPTPQIFPFAAGNVARRLTGLMIDRGVNAAKAGKASHHLIDYCLQQRLAPADLIEGELRKIDEHLTAAELDFLKTTATDGAFSSIAAEEKRINVNMIGKLRQAFKTTSPLMAAVLCASALFLASCGFKGDPLSNLVDPRPDIPYKPQVEKAKKAADSAAPTKEKAADDPAKK